MKRHCVIFGNDRAKVEREQLQVERDWKFGSNGLLLPDAEFGPIEEFESVLAVNADSGSRTWVSGTGRVYQCTLTQELEQVPLGRDPAD